MAEPPEKKFRCEENKECSSILEDVVKEKFTEENDLAKSRPKKRLEILPPKTKKIFQYGNYSRYYNYRNPNNVHDTRLDIFKEQKDIFENKEILDIGCNNGLITMEISKMFPIKNISGIDIDKSLINKLKKQVEKSRKYFTGTIRNTFPFNIKFIAGNYVLQDDVLLEIEKEQFDVILCLSVTKWIHLNFGDAGLKQAFKRMFLQLRPNGKLILEAQPWNGYHRRKKLTETIFEHFKAIKFLPNQFTNYLLGSEVGFSEVKDLGVTEHSSQGFRRPIQVFTKKS